MREIAGREDVSLLGVSGAMTMHGLGKLKAVSRGTLAGVRVAGRSTRIRSVHRSKRSRDAAIIGVVGQAFQPAIAIGRLESLPLPIGRLESLPLPIGRLERSLPLPIGRLESLPHTALHLICHRKEPRG